MKRILIVEDQVDIRELVSMTLELEDYDVHEAENGDQGLVAAQALAPDLMLLDVMMPGSIDGIEVCRRLKADARTRKIKIIILSAKGRIRIAFRVGRQVPMITSPNRSARNNCWKRFTATFADPTLAPCLTRLRHPTATFSPSNCALGFLSTSICRGRSTPSRFRASRSSRWTRSPRSSPSD